MAQPYVTGPVPVWIGLALGNSPLFLGYAERTPRIQWRPQYADLFVDVGGTKVPFDVVKQGTDAMVTVDLTYIQQSTYALLGLATAKFTSIGGDLGTLMAHEQGSPGSVGTGFPIWLPFRYRAKITMRTMEAGYRFLCGFCVNDDIDQMGTVPIRKRLVFHCIRKFLPGFNNAAGCGQMHLCDNDVSAVATQCPSLL